MTYDLFHQLLYISSKQNDSSEFLHKLESMTASEILQHYTSLQTPPENSEPAPDSVNLL